jgi:hypothetical protein
MLCACFAELVEAPLPELGGTATELGVPLPGGHLEAMVPADSSRFPAKTILH